MTSSEAKENLRMESADFKEMQRGKNSAREAFISTGLTSGLPRPSSWGPCHRPSYLWNVL